MITGIYKNILIIGANTAGLAAANQARRINPELNIKVLESGEYISYGSCGLPFFISGLVEKIEDLLNYSVNYFEEKRKIGILLNHRAVSINPFKKEIIATNILPGNINDNSANTVENTLSFPYDRLIICSGARPLEIDIEGINANNVFYFRSIKDAVKLKKYINDNNPGEAVILGGGYIGLLLAEALKTIGMGVSIIEKKESVLSDYEKEVIDIINAEILKSGVKIYTSSSLIKINKNSKTNAGFSVIIQKTPGQNMGKNEIYGDLFIMAAGIKANTGFLTGTSIDTGKHSAIKVSDRQQTSQPGIYAAGDCAMVKNIVTRSYDYIPDASIAIKTGRIAGANAAGQCESFKGTAGTRVDRIFGYEIARTGITLKEAGESNFNAIKVSDTYLSHVRYMPGAANMTVSIIIDKNTRRILGAQMIGKKGVSKRIDVFAAAISAEMTVDDAYMIDTGYSPSVSTMPDAVTRICGKAIIALRNLKF